MNRTFNRKAILWGVGLFSIFYAAHILVMPPLMRLFENAATNRNLYLVHQLLGILTCVVAGFAAGWIAGQRGFAHGLCVGVAATLLSAFAAMLFAALTTSTFTFSYSIILWSLTNGFLCGIAGMTGEGAKKASRG